MADHSAAMNLFLECGIDKRRAEETLKNAKLLEALTSVLTQAKSVKGAIDMKDSVNVLYTVASTLPAEAITHRPTLVDYVATGKIHKGNVLPAIAYLKKLGSDPLNTAEFEKETGVGVVVTREDVTRLVKEHLESIKADLMEQKWSYPINTLMAGLREKLKWANQKDVKDETDAQLLALLGPKVAEEKGKKKPAPEPKKKEATDANAPKVEAPKEILITFPDPRDNKQKNPALLEKHLDFTKGRVICRFPPEPNGYLHLGHAKACNLNFSYPQKSGGYTLLRFDDTNPEAEKTEYIEGMIDDVQWLGHKPAQITYSSDYFPQLYEMAIQLIRSDKAYVDHQTKDEMADYREKRMDSPWRNRPIAESLKLFEDMRRGKIDEGKATLRMKMDMKSDNTVMRDLVAYRIKFAPHPHVGDRWCVYPSYDYTHCIIDSLENVTHSLCSLEFAVRRESYMRLLDDLAIYKPVVWEYSRLNLTHTVLSKRKLIALVNQGYVRGWDDPRMPTVRGARRRGITAKALNDFCDRIGVTRNDNLINIELLEQCNREDLNEICHRSMVVMEPLKVTIVNMKEGEIKTLTTPNHPTKPEMGTHEITMSNVIFIERTDFREDDPKGYKRLSPGKTVGLLHACTITCTDVVKDASGHVTELKATATWEDPKKPRGWIHWVSAENSGKSIEIRLYDHLFKSAAVPLKGEEWVDDLNPHSLITKTGCMADAYTLSRKVGDQLQFERLGYFIMDIDSTPERPVWNRTVTLKEAAWEAK